MSVYGKNRAWPCAEESALCEAQMLWESVDLGFCRHWSGCQSLQAYAPQLLGGLDCGWVSAALKEDLGYIQGAGCQPVSSLTVPPSPQRPCTLVIWALGLCTDWALHLPASLFADMKAQHWQVLVDLS